LRIALSFLPLSLHHSSATATHQANSFLIRLFSHFHRQSKTCASPLCNPAEVIPTSSGRSPYPPSALTRGRLAHSVHPPFLRFLSMLPHYISPFRNPHGSISSFQRWLKAVFPFLVYGYWIADFEQNYTSLVLVKMTSYWCCEYIPPFSQKVMYHINPAVIKSILSSMPKEEFYRHARYIHSQMLSLPVGTNRQAMFFNLWQWCLRLHRERFGG
jgi:hypothetical protein